MSVVFLLVIRGGCAIVGEGVLVLIDLALSPVHRLCPFTIRHPLHPLLSLDFFPFIRHHTNYTVTPGSCAHSNTLCTKSNCFPSISIVFLEPSQSTNIINSRLAPQHPHPHFVMSHIQPILQPLPRPYLFFKDISTNQINVMCTIRSMGIAIFSSSFS